jgi:alpha-galactosidase
VTFDWAHEYVSDDLSHREARFWNTTYQLRDLWAKRDAGTTAKPLAVTVPGHDVVLYRLRKT